VIRAALLLLGLAAPAGAQVFTAEFPPPAYDAPPCLVARGDRLPIRLLAHGDVAILRVDLDDLGERTLPAWQAAPFGIRDLGMLTGDGADTAIHFGRPWRSRAGAIATEFVTGPGLGLEATLLRLSATDTEGRVIEGPTIAIRLRAEECGG
jgi:hypothetical protein